MPGMNLTREEARGRKALVDVASYEVTLDLTRGDKIFGSSTIINFSAKPGSSTFLDAVTAKIHSITLNGEALDAERISDGLSIQLENLSAENTLVVVSDAMYTNSGEGLHRFVDPADGKAYLYSQFEVADGRRVYACFDQPDLKATHQYTVIAPADWHVISNSLTPKPVANDGSDPDSTSRVWTFAPTPRLSPYVTAVIAGPYGVVHSELTSRDGRNIPLAVYARQSLMPFVDHEYIFDITRKGFEYYEEAFDYAYPFEKYDQIFVPEFNAGAMENAGAVTITDARYVFDSKVADALRERRVVTILHELAHMWFGDLVTMKWWNDLWLNESFAEWASAQASAEVTEWTEAWTTFAMMEKSGAYRDDQLPSTHPVAATINDINDVQVNFDHITYAKGGSVLKQLVAWVGLDAFYEGLKSYFRKHQFSNTELSDLLGELEQTSGRDLSEWSKVWLETAGVNTLRPEIETDGSGVITAFSIRQTAPADYPTIRPHRLAVGFYDLDENGTLVRTDRVELDVAGESTSVDQLVGRSRPDLVLLNDDDLAYAKIRLDDDSLAVATKHLSDIESSMARALVWGAAWDAMRDGETRPSDFVDLVIDHIGPETESTTIRVVIEQLITTVRFFVAPARRAATREKAANALLGLARTAAAGSDAQFQFVKYFAALANTSAHAVVLADIRDGKAGLVGLEVDGDLGWELLEALVRTGAAGAPEIADALAKDNTAKGQVASLRATGAIPTVEAKRAAFDSVVLVDDKSNSLVRAVTYGVQDVADPALLQPLLKPYFEMIAGVWESRSYKIAEAIIPGQGAIYPGLYPSALASRELADATRVWLDAHPDIDAAVRRMLIEELAFLERALIAQAKDA